MVRWWIAERIHARRAALRVISVSRVLLIIRDAGSFPDGSKLRSCYSLP